MAVTSTDAMDLLFKVEGLDMEYGDNESWLMENRRTEGIADGCAVSCKRELDEAHQLGSPPGETASKRSREIETVKTENPPFHIAEINEVSIKETNEVAVNHCHACLSRCTSVAALSDCLRDTYVALCGEGATAPAMCHLCRRLLLNTIRFKEQCQTAFSLLQYLNINEHASQDISDDFQNLLVPHLNLTIAQNCNVYDIKYDPDAATKDVTAKPTKNLEINTKSSTAKPLQTAKKAKVGKNVAKLGPSKNTKKVDNKIENNPVAATPPETPAAPKLYFEIHPLPRNLDSDDDNFDDTPLNDIFFVKTDKCSTTNTEGNAVKTKAISQNNIATTPKKIIKKNNDLLQEKRFNDHMMTKTLTLAEQMHIVLQRKDGNSYKMAKFKCDVCYRSFRSKQSYECHMYNHSSDSGPFACEVCHNRYPSKRLIKAHVVSHMYKYTCKLCSFNSQCRNAAKNHISLHEKQILQCNVCDMVFRHRSTHLSHMRVHHPSSSFTCQLCGYSFLNKKGLRVHKQKIHLLDDRKIPEDGPYCEKCNTRFLDSTIFNKHLDVSACADRSNHNRSFSRKRREIKCELCLEVLQSYVEYQCHFKAEHPDKTSTQMALRGSGATLCEICGKHFKFAASLKYHMPVHDPTTTYPCDQCGGSYASLLRLSMHKKKHTYRYSCHICGREFNQISNRDRHVKYGHTNVRNAKCRFCDKMFKCEEHRKTHEAFVHLNRPYPKRNRKVERERSQLKREK